MNLIAAVDRNWGIGNQGKLLAHISEDMKRFRTITMGHVLVIGRKTLDSFPGGKPLPGRVNIVMTTNPRFKREDIVVCHNVKEVLEVCDKFRSKLIFVAGGGCVYNVLLPYCHKAYITKFDKAFLADTHIANLDQKNDWQIVWQGEQKREKDMAYQFVTYERRQNGEKTASI